MTFSDGAKMTEKNKCKFCGCVDEDCSQCIDKTGEPCSWTVISGKDSVCTRCYAEKEHTK
jgi:hypothetical protein